jgi:hypothetical protein
MYISSDRQNRKLTNVNDSVGVLKRNSVITEGNMPKVKRKSCTLHTDLINIVSYMIKLVVFYIKEGICFMRFIGSLEPMTIHDLLKKT